MSIEVNATIAKVAGIILAGYGIVTENYISFGVGLIVGFLLDAGIKYVTRVLKYEKRSDENGRRKK